MRAEQCSWLYVAGDFPFCVWIHIPHSVWVAFHFSTFRECFWHWLASMEYLHIHQKTPACSRGSWGMQESPLYVNWGRYLESTPDFPKAVCYRHNWYQWTGCLSWLSGLTALKHYWLTTNKALIQLRNVIHLSGHISHMDCGMVSA